MVGAPPEEAGVPAPHWSTQPTGPVPEREVPTASGSETQQGHCLPVPGRWKAAENPYPLTEPTHSSFTCKHSPDLCWRGGDSGDAGGVQEGLSRVAQREG